MISNSEIKLNSKGREIFLDSAKSINSILKSLENHKATNIRELEEKAADFLCLIPVGLKERYSHENKENNETAKV